MRRFRRWFLSREKILSLCPRRHPLSPAFCIAKAALLLGVGVFFFGVATDSTLDVALSRQERYFVIAFSFALAGILLTWVSVADSYLSHLDDLRRKREEQNYRIRQALEVYKRKVEQAARDTRNISARNHQLRGDFFKIYNLTEGHAAKVTALFTALNRHLEDDPLQGLLTRILDETLEQYLARLPTFDPKQRYIVFPTAEQAVDAYIALFGALSRNPPAQLKIFALHSSGPEFFNTRKRLKPQLALAPRITRLILLREGETEDDYDKFRAAFEREGGRLEFRTLSSFRNEFGTDKTCEHYLVVMSVDQPVLVYWWIDITDEGLPSRADLYLRGHSEFTRIIERFTNIKDKYLPG